MGKGIHDSTTDMDLVLGHEMQIRIHAPEDFGGDLHISEAESQMIAVCEFASFGGILEHKTKKILSDGTVIQAHLIHGIQRVDIYPIINNKRGVLPSGLVAVYESEVPTDGIPTVWHRDRDNDYSNLAGQTFGVSYGGISWIALDAQYILSHGAADSKRYWGVSTADNGYYVYNQGRIISDHDFRVVGTAIYPLSGGGSKYLITICTEITGGSLVDYLKVFAASLPDINNAETMTPVPRDGWTEIAHINLPGPGRISNFNFNAAGDSCIGLYSDDSESTDANSAIELYISGSGNTPTSLSVTSNFSASSWPGAKVVIETTGEFNEFGFYGDTTTVETWSGSEGLIADYDFVSGIPVYGTLTYSGGSSARNFNDGCVIDYCFGEYASSTIEEKTVTLDMPQGSEIMYYKKTTDDYVGTSSDTGPLTTATLTYSRETINTIVNYVDLRFGGELSLDRNSSEYHASGEVSVNEYPFGGNAVVPSASSYEQGLIIKEPGAHVFYEGPKYTTESEGVTGFYRPRSALEEEMGKETYYGSPIGTVLTVTFRGVTSADGSFMVELQSPVDFTHSHLIVDRVLDSLYDPILNSDLPQGQSAPRLDYFGLI